MLGVNDAPPDYVASSGKGLADRGPQRRMDARARAGPGQEPVQSSGRSRCRLAASRESGRGSNFSSGSAGAFAVLGRSVKNSETSMDLSGRGLTRLPTLTGDLTKLAYLNLDGNRLTELPVEVLELSTLKHLHLDGNLLSDLPESIKKLEH